MSQAVVDPQDLRRFAFQLKKFKDEVLNQMQALRGQFQSLGQTWRDQEHQKFAEQFEETVMVLSRFVAVSEEQIPYLTRKADRIEEYLNQR
jgi:uncharacterized protein YukE